MKQRILILALCGIFGFLGQAHAWSTPVAIESAMSGTDANPVCLGIDPATSNLFFAYGGRAGGGGRGLGVNTFSVATGLAGTSQTVGEIYSDNAIDCAIDSNGNYYVSHSRLGNYDIYYVTYSAGAWGSDVTLDASTGNVNYSAVAADSAGNLHIVYEEGASPNLALLYATGAPTATASSWDFDTIEFGGTVNVGLHPAIAIDSSDTVHVAYFDGSNNDLKYASKAATATAFTVQTDPVDPNANYNANLDIAIDSEDGVHISYLNGDDVKHAAYTDGAWTIETVDSASASYHDTSITAVSPTSVHITYWDNTTDKLKYATNVTGEWVSSDIVTTNGYMSDIASGISGDEGSIYISYYNTVSGAIELVYNTCGNATVDASEECDGGDGCGDNCEYSCGNESVDATEECDDGNSDETDSCLDSCESAACGDGKVWSTDGGAETCDDANVTAGDGCSATCAEETGYDCTGTPSTCATTCGDGVIAGTEACDDGNATSGDGCSSTCAEESGYDCTGSPSTCATTCGDGVIAGSEACDDGNATSGDGCSSTCAEESGYDCTGSPSTCSTTCGDGVIAGSETCDDGNATSGDGCSSTCAEESGYDCTGTPSTCATTCGDSVIAGTETCDDGDLSSMDACTNKCTVAVCGDGYIWNSEGGTENCDDSNTTDADGCSATCTLEHPPVANAGTDLTVTYGTGGCGPTCTLFILDGRLSSDPDLDAITYSWTLTAKPAGSTVSILYPTRARTGVRVSMKGTYTFTLTVTDADGYTATDSVSFTVR